jgi:hypothetical protein
MVWTVYHQPYKEGVLVPISGFEAFHDYHAVDSWQTTATCEITRLHGLGLVVSMAFFDIDSLRRFTFASATSWELKLFMIL